MRVIKTTFYNSGLSLEARLDLPDVPGRRPGVVLCHPHPLYGGNMDNNVIMAVSRALAGFGIASLRFNFRGVGLSQGSFADGVGEQDDAESALAYLALREEINPERIGIMGYSFGGMVAMAAGGRSSVARAVAAVSPVVPLRDCPKPKLIVTGGSDSIIPASAVLLETGGMALPKKIEVIAGADHFWWGCEDEAANRVAAFFKEALGGG